MVIKKRRNGWQNLMKNGPNGKYCATIAIVKPLNVMKMYTIVLIAFYPPSPANFIFTIAVAAMYWCKWILGAYNDTLRNKSVTFPNDCFSWKR